MTMSLSDMADSDSGPRSHGPRRRTFSAAYKARILSEYEEAEAGGQRGALLRREGLYYSHIKDWKKARAKGSLEALQPRRSGPAPKTAEAKEAERLAKENARLSAELDKTKKSLEILGKAHELLELLSESTDSSTASET